MATPQPGAFLRKLFLLTVFAATLAASSLLVPAIPAKAQLPSQSSVSQYGITWTFDKSYPVGQFVNGDYYVVGPVKITSISPAPAKTSTTGRNGSMKNPGFVQKQGYDSRVDSETFQNSTTRFDPNLMVTAPITLAPGDSLVSTISNTSGTRVHVMSDTVMTNPVYSVLDTAAVLTVLDREVPADTFRPPYTYPSSRTSALFRASDLRWDLLPSLPIKGTPTKPISYWERVFQRPWIDHLQANWSSRYIHPLQNMPDYGGDMSTAASEASLYLMSNLTSEQKKKLMINFVQWGIDTYGNAKGAGPGKGWFALGGHASGRKFPMLFAGSMLGSSEIINTMQGRIFGEDQQTYYGTGWNGSKVLFTRGEGIANGTQSVIKYEEKQPRDWGSQGVMQEGYRRTSTSRTWYGQALLARKMNLIDEWNHNAWFDYVDRWMSVDDDADRTTMRNQLGSRYVGYWDSGFYQKDGAYTATGLKNSNFGKEMWASYRNSNETTYSAALASTSSTPSPASTTTVPVVTSALSPVSTTSFASDIKTVALSWNPIAGKKYHLRIEDETAPATRTISSSQNNCGGDPHYVCINGLASHSFSVNVLSGHTYRWWVHVEGNDASVEARFKTESGAY